MYVIHAFAEEKFMDMLRWLAQASVVTGTCYINPSVKTNIIVSYTCPEFEIVITTKISIQILRSVFLFFNFLTAQMTVPFFTDQLWKYLEKKMNIIMQVDINRDLGKKNVDSLEVVCNKTQSKRKIECKLSSLNNM